ncbi:hypothetical protein ACHWQZ_G001193 [Mnemiopsis leidyi]
MIATAHPFSITNILENDPLCLSSNLDCNLTSPNNLASPNGVSSPGSVTSTISVTSTSNKFISGTSPAESLSAVDTTYSSSFTSPSLLTSPSNVTSSSTMTTMSSNTVMSPKIPNFPHMIIGPLPGSSGTGQLQDSDLWRQRDTINTFTEELMKNFGTSLMKLGGLVDPVSLIPDQSNSVPWPFLIASSLNKHGMIKTRKRRTTFSREQLIQMEKTFQKHPYLTPAQRADLAKSLNLAQIQVQVWFQNRRAKCKKTGI